MLPALALSAGLARGARRILGPRVAWSIPVLAILAVLWTTPWDNYLVAHGIWRYGPDRVIGTIGWVPLEEYLFVLLQPVLTSLLLLGLLRRGTPAPVQRSNAHRIAGVTVWLAIAAAGGLALSTQAGTYLGLILVWAAPVAAGQWAVGEDGIRRRGREVLGAVVIATGYLCVADAFAIRAGIWFIEPATSTGLLLLGLPVEEAIFFLLTNVLIVQGLVLFLDPPSWFRTSS
jgi:lycopene cyclase domain-containing protein